MTLEATPIQPAVDAGHVAPPLGEATDAARDRSSSPSTLSQCIAWIFGLEAFLREPKGEEDKRVVED